ncbi:endo-1 4-beta-xylanase A [Biomphalaria pfeifferi]|uniref:Endo-1 4-beta-xylanase A n=1 Tax=Biomphalaria pfeifferi TaxID=112525 RepID=A0AAD8FAW6_BIOPF|nr:endo-1 4-beta-xylanase A [Biomphalaria pfeifferi]
MADIMSRAFLTVLMASILVLVAPDMLINPDFENGINGWHSDGFTMSTDNTHVKHGVASVKCSGRTKKDQGPSQFVTLKPGGRYTFNGFIKLANDHGYQDVHVTVELRHSSGPNEYIRVSNHEHMSAADDWVHVGGNFIVPNNHGK